MAKTLNVLGKFAQFLAIMIILNVVSMFIGILSFGLLIPIAIFLTFTIINAMIKKKKIEFKSLQWSSIIVFSVLSLMQVIIFSQYLKILLFTYVFGYFKYIVLALLILVAYTYIFNTYFIYLSIDGYKLKTAFSLSLIAPFHSIKQSIFILVSLISVTIFFIKIPSMILLIGITLPIVLNNIILESYSLKIKEKHV